MILRYMIEWLNNSRYKIANNEISSQCKLRVLKIYGMDEKLLVFHMKLKTGYFGISKLDRTLYMLIHERENIGFLLDKELEVFYNTTHTNTDKILSISSSWKEKDSDAKFTFFYDSEFNSESTDIFLISYLGMITLYCIQFLFEYVKFIRKRRINNSFDRRTFFIYDNFSFTISLYNIIMSVKDIWIMWYFCFENPSVLSFTLLFLVYFIISIEIFWTSNTLFLIVDEKMRLDDWVYALICSAYFGYLLWSMLFSGFLFESFLMKILVDPSFDILFFIQTLIWLPRICINFWYK